MRAPLLSSLLLVLLSACAPSAGTAPSPVPPTRSVNAFANATAQGSKISHVVFVIQENRSFNFMFMGYPGALTQSYGYDENGDKIALHPQTLSTLWDIDHSLLAFVSACDGTGSLPGTDCKLDGWNKEAACCAQPPNFAYAYALKNEVAPYWAMARSYVLADNAFQSNLDGSFVAHQYAIAAYASHAVDDPSGDWGCEKEANDTVPTLTAARVEGTPIRPCFDNLTIGDEADAANLTWRYYAGTPQGDGGIWSAYQVIRHIYHGPDWKADVFHPPARFLRDIASGTLANITWITPTDQASDHPGLDSSRGPAWVTSVVDAVGESRFWNSTAIFVLWDDWGGWYDPVQPVFEDYDGLGFRIPLIMISPYAKRGYVGHVQYETSSVLKFVEDTFGLAPLAASDARAADPAADAFDFTQQPRPFVPFRGARPASYWLARPQYVAPIRFGSMSEGD